VQLQGLARCYGSPESNATGLSETPFFWNSRGQCAESFQHHLRQKKDLGGTNAEAGAA
jgi:hypothetical protein